IDADTERGICRFRNTDGTISEVKADLFVGADGAGSALRNAFYKHSASLRFSFSQQFLTAGYKELHIPPGNEGGFLLEKNALHIWPRGRFMMIGLPNLDGSFTMTLFTDFDGENGFESLQAEDDVEKYFNKYFPDASALMPDLKKDFFMNPTGSLGTVKCWPWQYGGKFALLGDAAHAVVPFYGQGMNCSFEDCVVLDQLIDQYGDDWPSILPKYQDARKQNTDAIADLAVENFVEMRDLVADPVYIKKRQLETRLEFNYPDYFSKYSMVTFRADLPYSFAKEMGNKQNQLLMDICSTTSDISTLDTDAVMDQIRKLRTDRQE
ncbi:MAG TPA: FAD-dependent monooxygenase, partial [Saprospiraceae bacterium]|nr:FAD-dependent monooxygenase [Saprospiraceae bacterium]